MLSADLLELGHELDEIRAAGARVIHVDVMDGHFCPQLTVGPVIVKAIAAGFVKDVHLMVEDPLRHLDDFVAAGAGMLCFHLEATRHPHQVVRELEGSGVRRGVAVNPGTPVALLEPLLDDIEHILLLSVNPGFANQQFLRATLARLAQARDLAAGRPILLGVDGGITAENLAAVAAAGPDFVVTGRAVFDGRAPAANYARLTSLLPRGSG